MIITRLIVREWLKAYSLTVFVLIVLLIVANVTSELLRNTASAQLIAAHIMLELCGYLQKIFPLASLIASLFSLHRLRSHNELVSIFSLGYSVPRYWMVIGLTLPFVVSVHFVVNAYLAPLSRASRSYWFVQDDPFRIHRNKKLQMSDLHGTEKIWYKNHDYFASFSGFDKTKKELKGLTLYYYDEENLPQRIIHAPSAIYNGTKKEWVGYEGYIKDDLMPGKFPQTLFFEKLPLLIQEGLDDFAGMEEDIIGLNIKKLNKYIHKMELLNIDIHEYQVILFDMMMSPLYSFIFAFIPLGSFYHPQRRGLSLAKTVLFIISFITLYWLLYYTLITMGQTGKVSPLMATGLLPLITAVIAFGNLMLQVIRR